MNDAKAQADKAAPKAEKSEAKASKEGSQSNDAKKENAEGENRWSSK